ncbi:aminoglycoside phosphotransferase family protein [Streptomyces sp. NPDC050560]|uniref:aminoglycoside phosphotransferase family protein n=1 Tax=Streptomyces sp. NPDC050560 TaxID=3365630 RepID=UPI0037915B81
MTEESVPVVELACTALAGTSLVEVRRASTNAGTAVYRVALSDERHVVVKLVAAGRSHSADDEARLLAAVAASGRVAVPAVIASGSIPGLGTTALITADVGPSTLGEAVREGQVTKLAAMVRLARLLNVFHTIKPPANSPLAPGILAQISALARHCPSSVFALLAPALEVIAEGAADGRQVWCHGDLHFENVVHQSASEQNSGRNGLSETVIDLAASTVCVPEYDLAQTLVTCDALAPSDRVLLAAAYGWPVDHRLVDAFVIFQAVRGWTYAAYREGRHSRLWAARLRQALNSGPAWRSERNG